ncbi:uncharacterized protein LOC116295538 [Actinia tenebrosa]|uniref:Uncharacterized protein LOC116295538 n=1 Tax=Actinia tenebrosa TaxID=6105 RepID=A0A6P8HV49_ACTTE|nr:uncharacterized protein LOC116295538 [Actinia tenebrosa]
MSGCNDKLESCTSTMDERQALLSVSVTFKSQENLEANDNSESKSQGKDDIAGLADAVHEEEASCETEHKGFTPSSIVNSKEGKVKAETRTKSEVTKAEILPGWKGYGNGIYIQPIIVNSSKNQENKKSLQSGKFTVEDLRQQLRLRQSSEWVVKHNQRIHLKGSLKTGAPHINSEINTCISRCHSSRTATGSQEPSLSQHSHSVKQTSKLAKGFVCRHWTRDFLSKDNESEQESEPSSLTIRSYVNVDMMEALSKTTKASEHKKRVCPDRTRPRQHQNASKSSPDYDDENSHQLSRRSSLSSSLVSNEIIPKDNLHQDINDLIFGNISVNVRNPCTDDSCSCRLNEIAATPQATETCSSKLGKEKGKSRNMLKPRKEQRMFVHVPLKEFPPIDPLRDLRKSSKIQTMGKRKLPRRPHTVGAPCSFSDINKKTAESIRISSSKSLGYHFRGIHGKAVEYPLKNWQNRGKYVKP